MVLATGTRSTDKAKDIALARWKEQVRAAVETGDLFGKELRALGVLWNELIDQYGVDGLGLDYALPTTLLDMFRGFDITMGTDTPTVIHSNGLFEGWRDQCVIRGWLAPDDHSAA